MKPNVLLKTRCGCTKEMCVPTPLPPVIEVQMLDEMPTVTECEKVKLTDFVKSRYFERQYYYSENDLVEYVERASKGGRG